MNFTEKLSRSKGLMTLVWLIPLFAGVILLVLGVVPHFYYLSNGQVLQTMSLFGILDNTYRNITGILNGTENGSVGALYFSYIMLFFFILSWICIAIYAIFAIGTLTVTTAMRWKLPTDEGLNNMKRYYRILVPNRFFFCFFQCLPILPAGFPYILGHFFKSKLGNDVKLFYFTLPDVWVALILSVLGIVGFVLASDAFRESRFDVFRLYKKEDTKKK